MNDDYLWNKSGEPDPEIERLENTLGRLRYQRPIEPLPLPATSRRTFRYGVSPTLAAAAAFVILILAGGVWLGLRQSKSLAEQGTVAGRTVPAAPTGEASVPDSNGPSVNPAAETPAVVAEGPDVGAMGSVSAPKKQPRRRFVSPYVAVRHPRTSGPPPREQLARGESAKAQLIMALHIASDKLNVVQKRIQSNPGT